VTGSPSDDATVEAARHLLRQGLLSEAQAALGAVSPSATDVDRAAAELLIGNIAFERGEYDSASAAWTRAADLYGRVEPGGEGEQAARQNLGMVRDRLERLAAVETRVEAVQAAVALVSVLALAAVVVAWRRSYAAQDGRESGGG
jgi:hypothetical protein